MPPPLARCRRLIAGCQLYAALCAADAAALRAICAAEAAADAMPRVAATLRQLLMPRQLRGAAADGARHTASVSRHFRAAAPSSIRFTRRPPFAAGDIAPGAMARRRCCAAAARAMRSKHADFSFHAASGFIAPPATPPSTLISPLIRH